MMLLTVAIPARLYHGTCKAFVAYAHQNNGKFGSELGISFTPSLGYAQVFAESWGTPRGLERLQEYFSHSIGRMLSELSKPVILRVRKPVFLKGIRSKLDCGNEEYYLERGSIDLALLSIVAENKRK